MALSDSNHPVWQIATILAVAVLIVSVEAFNANTFDADEHKKNYRNPRRPRRSSRSEIVAGQEGRRR